MSVNDRLQPELHNGFLPCANSKSGSGCQERCIRKNYEAIPGLNRKAVCDGWEMATAGTGCLGVAAAMGQAFMGPDLV